MSRPRQPQYSAYCTGANGTYAVFHDLNAWDEGDAESSAYSRWKWAYPDETLIKVIIDCVYPIDCSEVEYIAPTFGAGVARWN